MVYTVVRGCEDEFTKEAETSILYKVLADMNKSAPRTVNEHNGEQHDGRNAGQDANRRPDKIGVRAFQEKVSIGDR